MMRLLVVGCVALLVGLSVGFYGASAASGVKYDGYLYAKDAAKWAPQALNGYVAGNYDTLVMVTWMANERPQMLTAETLTKQLACMQKIPSAQEAVGFAKDVWNASQNGPAAAVLYVHACEYNSSARSSSMTKTGGPTHSGRADFTILNK